MGTGPPTTSSAAQPLARDRRVALVLAAAQREANPAPWNYARTTASSGVGGEQPGLRGRCPYGSPARRPPPGAPAAGRRCWASRARTSPSVRGAERYGGVAAPRDDRERP